MNIRTWRVWLISSMVTLCLGLLVWGITSALAQEPGGEVEPQGDISAEAVVASQITYQGYLTEGGVPVTGARDMTFRFYSNSGCTTALTGAISKPGVSVSNGYFSVVLAVNQQMFNGQGVYLRTQVGATLLGCQAVLPAPYALGLRPGVLISGAAAGAGFGQAVVNIESTAASWLAYPALYARTASGSALHGVSGHRGVYGSGDWSYGVMGESSHGTGGYFVVGPDGGYAVRGESHGTQHWDHGGYFTSDWGYGIYAVSTHNDGIRGQADSWAGVHGISTSGAGVRAYSQSGHGVDAISENGSGVLAYSRDGHGVDATSWNHVAIYGASYVGANILELWELSPNDRRFRVERDGDVYADGTFNAGGADLAEMLPAVSGLEPGEVLVVGPDGRLTRSSQARQTSVVGVYSTRPGFLGGSPDDLDLAGRVPLAIVGVVPVKVSAENGAIRPGDLLVTSATPGHAMKADANPAPGTLLGKALGSLESGCGLLSVLVMLQ